MILDILELQRNLDVFFRNSDILREALTHRSYLNENPSWTFPHNERLEFLGDAVLELAVTEHLFSRFAKDDEGKLTGIRAALVNYQTLARIARGLGLGDFILMSRGEAKDNGKAREVILANAMEAFLGAIYIDSGYEPAAQFVREHICSLTDEIVEKGLFKDIKSLFQEHTQEQFKITPLYRVLDEAGPDHRKTFRIGVFLGDKKIAEGEGLSKQEAEVEAAKNGLYALKESGN